MPSLDDVASIALELPQATEREGRHGGRSWVVGEKVFAWERGLTKADIKRFGGVDYPTGEIVALRTADMDEKRAILAGNPKGAFDMEHFAKYPGYLIELRKTTKTVLRETLLDAWLACAPPKVAEAHMATRRGRRAKTKA